MITKIMVMHRRSQGEAKRPCPPQILEHIVISCFERRFSKQNSVIRLKSNILSPKFFPPPNSWAGYATVVMLLWHRNVVFKNVKSLSLLLRNFKSLPFFEPCAKSTPFTPNCISMQKQILCNIKPPVNSLIANSIGVYSTIAGMQQFL